MSHSLALPEILVQPTDQTNLIGTTAVFSVVAAGAPPVTYQWRSYSTTVTFTNIADATNDTLVLPDVQKAPYRVAVVVCDPSGCVTSALVQLVILSPPRITNEPPDQTVCLTDNYTNFPGTTGTTPLRYQWYFNGEPIPGKTTRILILSDIQFTNAGDYFVTVTNLYGAVTSRTARLTVECCLPTITAEPVDRRIGEGDTYTNQVEAVGTQPISYQWCFNGEALAGKTNTVLSIPNLTPTHAGDYTVIVTNLCGAVTSRVARLTVVGAGVTFTNVTRGAVVTDLGFSYGAGWADYDGDGWVDLFVVNRAYSTTNFLYHNLGDGTFERVTDPFNADPGHFPAATWWDYDNDGRLDLFVCRNDGSHLLYHNEGNGAFARVHDPALEESHPWGGLPAAADFDNDGAVDLVATTSVTNFLFRNNGDGTFAKVTTGPIPTDRFVGSPQFAAWGDYDNDGDQDLVVGTYNASETVLYVNQGNGTFSRGTPEAIRTNTIPGPVPVWGDCNNDGFLDLFLSSATLATVSCLYYNDGHGDFTKVAFPNVGANVSAAFGDYDNDGWLDLFLPNATGVSLLYRNNGNGTFTSIRTLAMTQGSAQHWAGTWADYDNDGFLDMYVTRNNNQPNFLYHNDGNSNHWLMVKLEGTVANRAAIGAKVRVRATVGGRQFWQLRQIGGDSLAQNDLRAHFGLGDATRAEIVRVEWPSGQVTELSNVAANQILAIKEPPLLKVAGWSPQGGFQMQVIGHANTVCDVLTSSTVSDPASWTPMQCVTNTSRTNLVVDPTPPPRPTTRFYKAVPR